MADLHFSNQGSYQGDKRTIFLAGPTTRNNLELITFWRKQVIEYFQEINNVCLFIPEPSDGNWPDFDTQVNWELHHLQICDVILFWIPREIQYHPGFTTNVEFGYWCRDERTIYGRPNDADKIRYLDHLWNYNRNDQIFNNLYKLLDYAKYKIRSRITSN